MNNDNIGLILSENERLRRELQYYKNDNLNLQSSLRLACSMSFDREQDLKFKSFGLGMLLGMGLIVIIVRFLL